MQTVLGTVASHLKWKNHPYTLDVLPLSGITNVAQTIRDARGRLLQTIQVLNGLLQMPYGFTSTLRTQLEDVRFHTVNALTLVDAAQRLGYHPEQPASDVDGLFAAIDNHVLAVERARGAWSLWLQDAHAQQTEADEPLPAAKPLKRARAVADFGEDAAPRQSMTPYLIAGGIALVMYMVMK